MKLMRWGNYMGLLLLAATFVAGCRHEPFVLADDGMGPIDTSDMVIDTMIMDTIVVIPCDTTKIYFEDEILPILRSSCAFSGCHNATSAQDGVILDSYANVIRTGDVRPFDLNGSDLYEVLVDDDEDDRMPPLPRSRLPAAQINLIASWILQGAENLTCDETGNSCVTENVSFTTTVKPIIAANCQGCHSGGSPSAGVSLVTYDQIRTQANLGSLLGTIDWQAGFPRMPQNNPKLDQCKIDQIASWIAAGTPNN